MREGAMKSSASTHQAKRLYAGSHSQNQATITSFFKETPSQASATSSRAYDTSQSLSPTLPPLVQANLLSVGMRVRKSVPEGYKTGKGYDGIMPTSDATLPMTQVPLQPRIYGGAARQELTPFCGIMKVGGMAIQQFWQPDDDEGVPGESNIPFLSSQESTISASSIRSTTETGHKRRYDEDDEEIGPDADDPDVFSSRIWQDETLQLSPQTRPSDSRALAVPRSRRRGAAHMDAAKRKVVMDGQENLMDFEEAEFLDYRTWDGNEMIMRDV